MKQSCQPVQCMCAPRTQARGLARSPRTQGIKLSPSPVSRAVPPADRVLERRRRRKLTHPRARTSAETTTPEGREPRPLADAPSGHLPVVPVPPSPIARRPFPHCPSTLLWRICTGQHLGSGPDRRAPAVFRRGAWENTTRGALFFFHQRVYHHLLPQGLVRNSL
jgi:hypothetical protein